VSLLGHGVLIALLALVGTRSTAPPGDSPLIIAELVAVLEPQTAPEAPIDDVAAGPDLPQPQAPIAEEPRAEPIEPATVAPPPAPEPRSGPEAAPPLPPEPPPVERVVETIEPPASDPPAEAAPLDVPIEPSRALASHEERAVLRRLSSWTGRFSAEEPDATLTWRDDGQEYTAVLTKIPAADAMGMEQLAVELTTERNGERLVTELRMNRLAFSNFGQFVNQWDPNVQIHDDVIDGRVHSNTALTVSRFGRATPVFNGKVTIAGGDIVSEGPGFLNRRKMFPAGIETHTRRIALPERAATLDAISPSTNSRRFERSASLTFHDDGTVSWRDLEDGAEEARLSLGVEPFYLIAAGDAELEVRGTVNGKVLVYSPRRIVIIDDLRYATDPRSPHADDFLGLVAERSVEIAEPEITGPGDLEIHASIYARSRFVVRDFLSRRSGTLIIHGSVTAGTLSATEPRFATRIQFDTRLTTMRAPGFPLSDRYELDSTSGEWRVVGTAD
jgi:hypothetical protein